ncbi:hypothetical protein ACQKEF_24220 [Pseudomonas oryzihabitans]|uniref:hypothetical protein n=1 Tax=Pseudomonas oryzihabitans TaxID=47885 RepID=UPI003D07BA7E
MEASLDEPLTIKRLCDYVNRSRRQLERLFRQQLDTASMRYYPEPRITVDRSLLQHSSLSMLEVAVACASPRLPTSAKGSQFTLAIHPLRRG